MQRSKSVMGRRAWNILRLALLWARKGGVLKKIRLDLHFLNHSHKGNGNGALQYGDRQLSFDATPMIHIRMHRPNSMRFRLPNIPCINPHSNQHMFDFDDDNDNYDYYQPTNTFLIQQQQEEEKEEEEEEEEEEDHQIEDGIDLKAEQFIANFYEQLKLQRQFNPTRRRSSD